MAFGAGQGASPSAQHMLDMLTRTNKFAVIYRVQEARRVQTRARRIQHYFEMLAQDDTHIPRRATSMTISAT